MCAITAKNVFKKYINGNQKNILFDNISLHVQEGEILYVSGDYGSGKTTLLKMIAAMTPPNQGTIEVFGKDLLTIEERSDWRLKHIGYLTAEDVLIPYLSVKQHLFMGFEETNTNYETLNEEVYYILSMLGIKDNHLDSYPEQLSNVDRLKVTLARVLMTNPRLLLLDEYTSGLTDEELFDFYQILVEFSRLQNITIILTGENSNCDIADQILRLENGKLLKLSDEQKNVLH